MERPCVSRKARLHGVVGETVGQFGGHLTYLPLFSSAQVSGASIGSPEDVPSSPENHLPPMVVRFISVSGATPFQLPVCQPPKNVSQHQFQIGKVCFVIEKRLLPPVSPLDQMVGETRCNRSGYSCHAFFGSYRFPVSIVQYGVP